MGGGNNSELSQSPAGSQHGTGVPVDSGYPFPPESSDMNCDPEQNLAINIEELLPKQAAENLTTPIGATGSDDSDDCETPIASQSREFIAGNDGNLNGCKPPPAAREQGFQEGRKDSLAAGTEGIRVGSPRNGGNVNADGRYYASINEDFGMAGAVNVMTREGSSLIPPLHR